MKTKKRFLILLVGLLSFSQQQANENNNQPTQIENENEEWDYEGHPKMELECVCCHLYGDQLKQCMQCLSPHDVVTNYFLLNSRAQDYYLRRLSPREVKEFCTHFIGEEGKKAFEHAILSRKVSIKNCKKGLEILTSYFGIYYFTIRSLIILGSFNTVDLNNIY